MALFALIIGIILIVSAVRNSQSDLFTALGQDVPNFIIWAAAIVAVGAIGFVPGLSTPSRLLLALVIIVLIVNNYQKLVQGFTNAWQPGASNTSAKATTQPGATSTNTSAPATQAPANSAQSTGAIPETLTQILEQESGGVIAQ